MGTDVSDKKIFKDTDIREIQPGTTLLDVQVFKRHLTLEGSFTGDKSRFWVAEHYHY